MKRTMIGIGTLALLGAVAWGVATRTGGGGDAKASPTPKVHTSQLERRDLVERDTFQGTLGYADAKASLARRAGTITKLAAEGTKVTRGEVLYEIDEQPTRLLYGNDPAWRTMTYGTEGKDVRQLQRNLIALGYGTSTIEVDGEFDSDTREAVEEWEEDLGMTEDGIVDLGDVEFLPGPRRVGAHKVDAGGPIGPGGEVLETTSTDPIVSLDIEAKLQYLVAEGDSVRVTMPDGKTVTGRITDVGRVAQTDGSAGEDGGESEPTIEVTIALREAGKEILDQAPVDVGVEKQRARNALAVPVAALLALAEGGYAIEVVDGSTTKLVAVETGMYAGGWVEVSGAGLDAGTEVVIAE